jgi:hypothetical protein
VVVTKRIDIKPKVSAKAEVLVNNPFEKLSMSLKTDNQVFLKPIQWIENEGKSFAFHGVSGDTLSGARVTGFENQVAIQYWWQNMKETNAFRMPKFELMVGTNLFGGKYKAFIFKDKQLIECKNLKKESTFETTEVTYGVKPGIVILYNPELNYCMGISFKNTDHVFIKKGSIGVTMSKQYCPSGRRKVMEGNVYLIKGNPSGLLQIIEHEMPVWKNALNN